MSFALGFAVDWTASSKWHGVLYPFPERAAQVLRHSCEGALWLKFAMDICLTDTF